MERDAEAKGALDAVTARLEARWEGRDPFELANRATAQLMDSASDWSPPPGVEFKRSPVRLGVGIPDAATLPREELLEALQRAMAAPRDRPLRYHFGHGFEQLREQLAARHTRDRGLPVDLDWFRLTNGSSGAIDLICRTLIEPGDVIVSEAPSYMGTLHNFRGVEAELRSVPMDEQGMQAEELEKVLREVAESGRRVKLIYTISSFQNPTGVSISEARRRELLRVASEYDALILEDDAYAELYFGEPPPRPLFAMSGGHGVISVGTFSKILATGLRVGWIHARPEWIEFFGRMRFDMGQSVLVHRMLAEYIEGGRLDAHVEMMRALYADKARWLCSSLEEFTDGCLRFAPPGGGFYLWVELLGGLTADALWRAGAEEGVWFPAGASFFPDRVDPTGEHIRLAFPWTSTEELREGARRIGLACQRLAREGAAR
jgi:2-aminoadipate transaminase